ncbi:MAG TPA: hypothetical protein VI299_05125 [Polyangiales bacterium]
MIDRVDGRRLGATLVALAAVLGVHFWQLGAARLHDFAPGFAYDACLLLAGYCLCEAFDWALGQRSKVTWIYYVWLTFAWGLICAHAWFFDVASERRLTPLDFTPTGIRYFFEVALPPLGLYTMLGGALLLALGGLAGGFVLRSLPRVPVVYALAFVVATGAFALVRVRKIPSPLFDASFELWELASRPRLSVLTPQPDPRTLALLDKSTRTRPLEPARYQKVIVLVMETMTADKLERERADLPANTFMRSGAPEQFTNYYPNNQDSRTGMLDMLFSRLIPYEAYSDEGYRGYRHLAGEPSLVDRMRALSYATAFAVAQTELEEVVGELGWDRTLHLSEGDIVRARAAGLLCFAPDEYERSCEDVALLPPLLDFVANNERAFVYQEFIWGHAAEYNRASGKTNAAYYSAYVDALQKALAERGLLDQTLIVVTSDHGFRDRGVQDRPSVYRIPLWFSAPDLAPRRDARLLSHADFGMLLFEHLTPSAPRADDNEVVMIVGPTGQGNLFAVGHDGYALMRHKAGLDLLISQEGALPYAPSAMMGAFRAYRAQFSQLASPAIP